MFFLANWKMNPPSLKEGEEILKKLKKSLSKKPKNVIIFPPFLYLFPLIKKFKDFFDFGAQNVFYEKKGAFTGEVSPLMLKNMGVNFAIIGHSERRRYFKEDDEILFKKMKACQELKIKVVFCIGESKKEREKNKVFEVLKKQTRFFSQKVFPEFLAYEPVWAIGTGTPCLPQDAKKVFLFLKKRFKKTKILYGGSVNSKNAKGYLEVGFDGLLVGGASLKAEEFSKIVSLS